MLLTKPLRALTVWQPYASLIAAAATVADAKMTENRCWVPSAAVLGKGDPLAIHAGKRLDATVLADPLVQRVLRAAGWRGDLAKVLPRGAVVCTATLRGFHRAEQVLCCLPWGQTDQYHWELCDVEALADPVPAVGLQKLWWWTPPAPVTAEQVTTAIRAHRYHYAHEDGLQAGITEALTGAGLPARREVRLAPRDRLDVLAGGVGIEVKVAGSPDSVLGQLQRYATSEQITALVLVTTVARQRAMPEQVGGKPLSVIYLGGVA